MRLFESFFSKKDRRILYGAKIMSINLWGFLLKSRQLFTHVTTVSFNIALRWDRPDRVCLETLPNLFYFTNPGGWY